MDIGGDDQVGERYESTDEGVADMGLVMWQVTAPE